MKHLASWVDKAPVEESLKFLTQLALEILPQCGPARTELTQYVLNAQYDKLLSYVVDYSLEWEVHEYMAIRQVLALFSKFEALPLGIDKEEVALQKFLAAEERCKEVNALFRKNLSHVGSVNSDFDPELIVQLFAARRLVAKVLRKAPDFSGLHFHFGPGATTSVKKLDACPMSKMASGFACSEQLAYSGYLESLLSEVPHWVTAIASSETEGKWVVDVDIVYGRLQFVLKNALTYRSVITEPPLCGIMQQGMRLATESRLEASGLGVKDQSRNQRLAREGSIKGSLATLDLSSASDTICTELVKFLIPEDWYRLYSACRTKTVLYKRGRRKLLIHQEKFCSMGNAFTFPLETLIFWALSTSAAGSECAAYGDDIIVPTCGVERVMRLLSVCGFSINEKKSYWKGPFRESCGADYYKGIDIRPYYQEDLVGPQDLFKLHNYFVRQYDYELAEWVKQHIPRHLRLYGPDGYGDGHLVSEVYPRKFQNRKENGFSGFFFDTFMLKGRKIRTPFPGDWVSPLYSIYSYGDAETLGIEFDKSGYPFWDLPGTEGYVKKSIYTLA